MLAGDSKRPQRILSCKNEPSKFGVVFRGKKSKMTKSSSSNLSSIKLNFIVLSCQVGDEHAFRELYEAFGEKTFTFLKSLVEPEVAKDLNQEVWLKVYRQISTLYDANRFKAWLFQIARNKALDYFKSSKRLREFYEMLKVESHPTTEINFAEVDIESSDLLKISLEGLPPKQREVIVLNFFEGMDYSEIAFIVNCSIGTVKSRLFNAKMKIKEMLETKIDKP